MKHKNPIVQEVIENFQTIERMSSAFTNKKSPFPVRGLLIHGDAGMGKTYYVDKGLLQSTTEDNIVRVKGSITAASLYTKLYLSRKQGKVLVLDDVDIINKSPQELMEIVAMLKAATEMTYKTRLVSWERVRQVGILKDMPTSFDYQGSIIWITNESITDMSKKLKGHWPAIDSRFAGKVSVSLDLNQKLMYTLHLVENEGLLSYNCQTHEGGYSQEVIDEVVDYVSRKWRVLNELSPRVFNSLAALISVFPNEWEMMADNQLIQK